MFSALTEEGNSDLWLTQVGAQRAGTVVGVPNAFCATPAWSPAGRLLAYSQRNANDFAAAAVSPPRLYLLDTQTGESAPVFGDSQKLGFEPRWSFDGTWLTYSRRIWSAWARRSGDRAGSVLCHQHRGNGYLASQPAGFSDERVGADRRSVCGAPGAGRSSGQHADELERGAEPGARTLRAWSPDGEWIAFRRNELAGERKSLSKQLWLMRGRRERRPPAHCRSGERLWRASLVAGWAYPALPSLSAEGAGHCDCRVDDGCDDRRTMARRQSGQRPQWLP